MSLKKFIARIWKSIKRFFIGLAPELKTAIHWGVVITDKVKLFVDSPTADVLTYLIPGQLDDRIKDKLRVTIPIIFQKLKLADECAGLTDPNEIVKCAVKTLQSIEGEFQNAFLHNFSILVAQVAADGRLDWSDGVFLLEWYYKNRHEADVESHIAA